LSDSTTPYTTDSVTSEGTTIGYRQIGSGPGLILLHGGMQASQHYMRLAAALSDAFTVYVPDRRGRGLSGSHGDQYSIAKECEDVDALLDKTGAHLVFGHSSGGLIALQAALTLPAIHKVAVYEPPLSLHGSIPMTWVPRYERELARGNVASAMITAIKGLKLSRVFTFIPRWLLLPLIKLFLQREKQALKPDDVSMEALIPTLRFDQQLVKEMDNSLESFKAMHAAVFLQGGDKSPAFLREALDALSKTLPHVERVEYPGLGHDAPNDTAPERISKELRAFFSKS
jgi:pimeloyl-ACP methyl ester carboxylesterase